jgi:manganese/iron transport system permease protein
VPAAVLDSLSAPYMQRALLEGAMLAVLGGVIGSWIVLHRRAFFAHAVGTAGFPGLVVAGPWGIPAQLGALAAGLGMAGGVQGLSRSRRIDPGTATGLLLVAFLAVGVVLASDVYESGAGVDRLLFGTLIGLSDLDLALTAAVTLAALALNAALWRPWLAAGFDPANARVLRASTRGAELLLAATIAVVVVVSLDAVGALLVSAVLVVPAATVLLFAPDVRTLQAGGVLLALAETVVALLAAEALNVGPGPALAALAAAVFAVAAAAQALVRRPSRRPVA